jgi:hypothetical protein
MLGDYFRKHEEKDYYILALGLESLGASPGSSPVYGGE